MKKVVIGAGAILLALALILAGCAPAPVEEEEAPAEKEEEAPPKRTDVVIALGDEPQTFDEHKNVAGVNYPIRNMYDLFGVNLLTKDRQGNQIGWLAERWEMADDGMSFHLWLRKGVTFTDGSPLTAKDVKFSLERLQNKEIMPSQTFWKKTDRIDIINDHEFIFT